MKSKTERKLIKRELNKPKHHIDTGVIIEATKETNISTFCENYLKLIGCKYRGCFSIPMLGELFLKTYGDIKDEVERELFFRWVFEFVEHKNVSFYSLRDLSLPFELTKIDGRVKGIDALILASAIKDKATLITLDTDLLKSEEIKRKYKVKILTPKHFV